MTPGRGKLSQARVGGWVGGGQARKSGEAHPDHCYSSPVQMFRSGRRSSNHKNAAGESAAVEDNHIHNIA